MGLMSKLFGGKVNTEAPGQLANGNKGELAIGVDKALAQTDSSAITPHNVSFESIRSVPVVEKPRYFNKQEADSLAILAKQKRVMASCAKTAYKALKSIDNSDTEVHSTHRRYQSKLARNEVNKLQANAQLAKDMHGLRPAYSEMHSSVETANVAAVNAINAIRQSYGS
jgi:hypothetical protein